MAIPAGWAATHTARWRGVPWRRIARPVMHVSSAINVMPAERRPKRSPCSPRIHDPWRSSRIGRRRRMGRISRTATPRWRRRVRRAARAAIFAATASSATGSLPPVRRAITLPASWRAIPRRRTRARRPAWTVTASGAFAPHVMSNRDSSRAAACERGITTPGLSSFRGMAARHGRVSNRASAVMPSATACHVTRRKAAGDSIRTVPASTRSG